MRKRLIRRIEESRIVSGSLASDSSYGRNGAFRFQGPTGATLCVIVSDGECWDGLPGKPWEHVSVSVAVEPPRCPTWEEMDFVARQFWGDDELVLQFHVPPAKNISQHDHCLHLWKPPYRVKLPPPETVGIKS